MAQGQAAGTAAAMAVRSGMSPADVDIPKLKEVLVNEDAILTV
jgi:hypothetical protein